MTSDQKKAYEWAKNQNYPSVAARYAKELAGLVDELQVASCARQEQERNASLTLDELREMDGEPVWCDELKCYGIIKVDTIGRWANVPFLIGMWRSSNCGSSVNFEYDIESRELTLYRHKPEEEPHQ